MEFIHVIILGIIQGVAEPFPISSSGHLILVRWLLGWNEFGPESELIFDVALHAGTLLALFFCFSHEFRIILNSFLQPQKVSNPRQFRYLSLVIILSSIPAGVAGLVLNKKIVALHTPLITGIHLVAFGIFLYIADHIGSQLKTLGNITISDAILMGLFQAFALVPGVSRSGATITGGLLRGYRREDAARFSFLMMTPLIAGATAIKCLEVYTHFYKEGQQTFSQHELLMILTGMMVSFIVGIFCIKWLLRIVQIFSLNAFVYYRVLVGLAVTTISIVLKI